MNEHSPNGAYGVLTEASTMTIQRLLPGPVERVWAYLADSELRRQWLASGSMAGGAGSSVELVWKNDTLTDPPGARPSGIGDENRMLCEITEFDPPRKLSFTWGRSGGVTFELAPRGDRALLTVTHRRLPDRGSLLGVSAGWHVHLDILVARMTGGASEPFWDGWTRLRGEYDLRLPA